MVRIPDIRAWREKILHKKLDLNEAAFLLADINPFAASSYKGDFKTPQRRFLLQALEKKEIKFENNLV